MRINAGPARATFAALSLMLDIAHADSVDDFITAQMALHRIPGLSMAVIEGGNVTKAKGYGFADQRHAVPVTPSTLFQAASISKSITAVAALHLVEKGAMSLDADVNTILKTWKVPENQFTQDKKVTVRMILSHTAGFTVLGFSGYDLGQALPTLPQILDGKPPAHNSPIRVNYLPGSKWRYSGGGYEVLQQIIVDVTGKPLADYMRETVLEPCTMDSSTFEQPLPAPLAASAASGFDMHRKEIPGQWHAYPEQAAASLWTTPTDLAHFCIALQRSFAGTENPVLSKSLTHEMMKVQPAAIVSTSHSTKFGNGAADGLGVFLETHAGKIWFSHNGRNEGFDCLMIASAETGQGLVVMINANDNAGILSHILNFVAQQYHWPGAPDS